MNNNIDFKTQNVIAFVLTVSFLCFVPCVSAQVRPVYDQGAIGLGQLLKRIGNTKRIMHIGAHPDDEDSGMLAYLARRENARTVYLSLTRGDGGQNVIGPELFEALGVIRAEELLQARTLDGARQMFTRAFDYGYSKTLAEAKSKWDEEIVKCDVVRAIRSFQPQVVVPRFQGTPADGHGQHQFAGYIAPIAVKAAADPNQCKDAGPVWKVTKFYVGQGFRDRNEPSLTMNTGEYDYLLGRSYYEIAARGRSQHKTQEQGGTELKGDRFSGVNLVDSDLVVRGAEDSMFDGLDTSFAGLIDPDPASAMSEVIEILRKIEADYEREVSAIGLASPEKAVAVLLSARESLIALSMSSRGLRASDLRNINEKVGEIENAVRLASGLQIDALSNAETGVAGEKVGIKVNVFFPEYSETKVSGIELLTPNGWVVSKAEPGPVNNSPFARFFRETPRISTPYSVQIPASQLPTQPYFLAKPRNGYLYRWANDLNQNRPFQPAMVKARVNVEIGGKEIAFDQPVEYRFADDTRGELRRNLNIVPKVTLDLDQHLVVIKKASRKIKRHISVIVTSNSTKPVKGKVRLITPKGWAAVTKNDAFELGKKGEGVSLDYEFAVGANAEPGNYFLRAVVESEGKYYTETMNTIAYDHIQTHRYYTEAKTKVAVMDVSIKQVRVGYVMGSGDSGPEALRQMGVEVELLDAKALTSADLSKFDTIVIGIRASETNPAYIANNQRLLEYVKNGGTMIVQYQKFAYQRLNLAPYPFRYNARVAEEDAKITILEPGHPVFNSPNKISQRDFEGWVQERNLYAFRSFDERYTPLLEAHDTGEDENKGGMVYTNLGKGKYMYVSYAFFRQLPAGVPGAYRLFANIVSLGEKKAVAKND